jgi:RHS repeat-associated protein
MAGRSYLSGVGAKEGYTGKERDAETGLDYFGARYYLGAIGRWGAVDALTDQYPSWSPYTYVLNNPLRFFDPNGMFPYTFHVRAFAPFVSFGGGFEGDNRSFSTSLNASARVHQRFTLDTDNRTLLNMETWSSPSSHPILGSTVADPDEFFSPVSSKANSLGNEILSFRTSFAGSNPLLEGLAPDIDVSSTFSVTENKDLGVLSIAVSIRGDKFPATEAFVVDAAGTSVFLGAGPYEGSPFTSLFGKNSRSIINVSLQIRIDSDGNFTSVIYNDLEYTVSEWNKMIGAVNPHDN